MFQIRVQSCTVIQLYSYREWRWWLTTGQMPTISKTETISESSPSPRIQTRRGRRVGVGVISHQPTDSCSVWVGGCRELWRSENTSDLESAINGHLHGILKLNPEVCASKIEKDIQPVQRIVKVQKEENEFASCEKFSIRTTLSCPGHLVSETLML